MLGGAEAVVGEQHASHETGHDAAEVPLPAPTRKHAEKDEADERVSKPLPATVVRVAAEVAPVQHDEPGEPADQSTQRPGRPGRGRICRTQQCGRHAADDFVCPPI